MDAWMAECMKGKEGGSPGRRRVWASLLFLTRKLVTFSVNSPPAPLALDLLFHSILVLHLQSQSTVPGLNLTSISVKELTKEESGLTPEQMPFKEWSHFLTIHLHEEYSAFTLPGDDEGKRKMNNLFLI